MNWFRRGNQEDAVTQSAVEEGTQLRWWELAGYANLLLAAALMRLWDLGSRAIHHDESLHALYSWNLSEGIGYKHDPMMHGPFQFEATSAIFFVFGDSDFTARVLYALAGTALVGLPFLFRTRLGRLGALLVATLLAFSPALLYFSRFARNDILVAVWTLGLVICMWRYIDEGRNRYLYAGSALLTLAFATKETAYIVTATLGLYLVMVIVSRNWTSVRGRITVVGVSPPAALGRVVTGVWSAYQEGVKVPQASRPATFLLILVTLSLPQWSALVGRFQDTWLLNWTNLVLANGQGVPPIGAPSGGGLVIAGLIVFVLLGVAVYWGFRWNWPVWWRCALIFYGVWVVLYTTFFTNMAGIGSGMWQSLGYWVVQQGEARGGQPWYYYFVISPLYEFLPLIVGVIAAVYYLRRNDSFGHFLVFWSVTTFILYTMASEKMPWLLVNVTLPLIILSGKFISDVVVQVSWRRLVSRGGILVAPAVPLFLVVLWRLAFFEASDNDATNVLVPLLLGLGIVGMAAVVVFLAYRNGPQTIGAVALVAFVGVLFVLTVRTGSRASYQNGDIPVEMIVYTQTSPDIPRLLRDIEQRGNGEVQYLDLPINIDSTSGFTWPWAWYFRDYTRVGYPSYQGTPSENSFNSSVVLVHSQNQTGAEPLLGDRFSEGERVRHRWWFPESTYRGLTLGKFLGGFVDRGTWRTSMDYFLHRRGVRDRIGSEDSYVYFVSEVQEGSAIPEQISDLSE